MKNIIDAILDTPWAPLSLAFTAEFADVGDSLAAAPDHYTLLQENDRVRTLSFRSLPGGKTPLHRRPAALLYPCTGCTLRFNYADGRIEEVRMTEGVPVYLPPAVHSVENTGGSTAKMLVVELKGNGA